MKLNLSQVGYIIRRWRVSCAIVQELCESRGGRPGLSVLTSPLVFVDVKNYGTVLQHWHNLSLTCQLTSEDIKHHFIIMVNCTTNRYRFIQQTISRVAYFPGRQSDHYCTLFSEKTACNLHHDHYKCNIANHVLDRFTNFPGRQRVIYVHHDHFKP